MKAPLATHQGKARLAREQEGCFCATVVELVVCLGARRCSASCVRESDESCCCPVVRTWTSTVTKTIYIYIYTHTTGRAIVLGTLEVQLQLVTLPNDLPWLVTRVPGPGHLHIDRNPDLPKALH